jgi:hypothetical protein
MITGNFIEIERTEYTRGLWEGIMESHCLIIIEFLFRVMKHFEKQW